MYVFLRSMSSHEDSTTGRNQEEKETEVVEEVDVVEDSTTMDDSSLFSSNFQFQLP